MFLKTVADEEATGRIAELYQGQKAPLGFVMEAMRCWTGDQICCPSIKTSPTRSEQASR